MPFAEPIINMMKDPNSPLSPENLTHYFESFAKQSPADLTGTLMHALTTDGMSPGSLIIDAHPDQVINAEVDASGATHDMDVLHEVNAVHPDDAPVHADTGTHDAYAYHDDASATGA